MKNTFLTILAGLFTTLTSFSQITIDIDADSMYVFHHNDWYSEAMAIDSALFLAEMLNANWDKDPEECTCLVPIDIKRNLDYHIKIKWDPESRTGEIFQGSDYFLINRFHEATDIDGNTSYWIMYQYSVAGVMAPHLIIVYLGVYMDLGVRYSVESGGLTHVVRTIKYKNID